MPNAARSRIGAVYQRDTVDLVAIYASAEAGVKEAILVVIAGTKVAGEFVERWHLSMHSETPNTPDQRPRANDVQHGTVE